MASIKLLGLVAQATSTGTILASSWALPIHHAPSVSKPAAVRSSVLNTCADGEAGSPRRVIRPQSGMRSGEVAQRREYRPLAACFSTRAAGCNNIVPVLFFYVSTNKKEGVSTTPATKARPTSPTRTSDTPGSAEGPGCHGQQIDAFRDRDVIRLMFGSDDVLAVQWSDAGRRKRCPSLAWAVEPRAPTFLKTSWRFQSLAPCVVLAREWPF